LDEESDSRLPRLYKAKYMAETEPSLLGSCKSKTFATNFEQRLRSTYHNSKPQTMRPHEGEKEILRIKALTSLVLGAN
jgi:hypothetical protein